MSEEKFWITNHFGEKLEVLLRKPTAHGKFPAVLFISGFSMDLHEYKNSNDGISAELVKHGFLTLQFSFAGRGRSEGDYREMTLELQARQVENLVDWLVQNSEVETVRIGIHATSFGCPTSILVKHPSLKSLCFVSGVYFLDQRFEKSLRADFTSTIVTRTGETEFRNEDGSTTKVGPQFWETNKQFNAITLARNIKTPVFMVHGDRDMYIEPEEAKKVFNAFAAQNKRFKLFTGGYHGINDVPRPLREEFLLGVVEWFKSTL